MKEIIMHIVIKKERKKRWDGEEDDEESLGKRSVKEWVFHKQT